MPQLTPEQQFSDLKARIQESLKAVLPVERGDTKLIVHSVDVDDNKDTNDIRSQKDALLQEKTWAVPVYADIELQRGGKTVDRKRIKVLDLPKTTDRYGYIVGGTEYQTLNQFRQKSGVYHRIADDGRLEAVFNLRNRDQFVQGKPFRIEFNPETALFYFKVKSSEIPAYNLFRAVGLTDAQLTAAWGSEILEKNKQAEPEIKTFKRFARAATREGEEAPSPEQVPGLFRSLLDKTELLPDTTERLLGKAFRKVEPDTLLRSTEALLGISRGKRAPDDRHSLEFMEIHSIEDLLDERMRRAAPTVQRKLLSNLQGARKQTVRSIVPADILEKEVNGFFHSSLSSLSEQTNPLEMVNGQLRTTIMGDQGGVKSPHAILEEAKLINPSHLGFLDPIHTPEGSATGISLSLPLGVRKEGNTLKAHFRNARTGARIELTPAQVADATVAFPDQYHLTKRGLTPIGDRIKAVRKGETVLVPVKEVDYVLPSARGLFDAATNLVPFLQNNQGNRAMTASRQQEQAVPLIHREAPLVQVQTDTDKTFEEVLGTTASHRSPVDGTVASVRHSAIVVKDKHGKEHEVQTYKDFPLKGHTLYDSEPVVKEGDKVKEGQLLADTTFTRGGKLALGTSLFTAYLPFMGYNFEDGIVISEGAAKKLTSAHIYRKDTKEDPDTVISKKVYSAHAGMDFNNQQMAKIGDEGLVHVGQVLHEGDPMILLLRRPTKEAISLFAPIRRGKALKLKPSPMIWDQPYPGTVTDVVHGAEGRVTLYVKTEEPAQVGDKLVGRHGNKGIIVRVMPDADMPYKLDGEEKHHVEIALNPLGVPGRINVGQVLETVAGKIAKKSGEVYKVKNFEVGKNYIQQVQKDLDKAGLTDKEVLINPKTGQPFDQEILTGNQYILKLRHQVGKKTSARSGGPGMPYNVNNAPTGGPPNPGMTIGELGLYAMLAHGARENLHEMYAYKSSRSHVDKMGNDHFWDALREGTPLPPPKVPFAYEKFLGFLNGMRVNVRKEGNSLQLIPFTEEQVRALAPSELKAPGLDIRGKDLRPEPEGIFDEKKTGGIDGTRWSRFALSEPLPNPLFEEAIKMLTGLNEAQFGAMVRGETEVNGKKGGLAVEELLKGVDVKKERKAIEAKIGSTHGESQNKLHRKLRILKALDDANLDPTVYMMRSVPVIPPVFRPLTIKEDRSRSNADLNYLYKDLAGMSESLTAAKKMKVPDVFLRDTRAGMYDGVSALMGMGTGGSLTRDYAGIADLIAGKWKKKGKSQKEGSPKEGYFHKVLIQRKQDFTGRSTIVPEPRMGLDELGLPEHIAWRLYEPFVQRELVGVGFKRADAQIEMERHSPVAEKALLRSMAQRPVLLKRDPVLHKFNVMAFKPRLIRGKAIEIHPLVTSGYNADFDGDQMSVFLPVTPSAVKEAASMYPSNNLFNPTTGHIQYTPGHEALLGLFLLSRPGEKKNLSFTTKEAAFSAVRAGKLKATDIVKVDGQETTPGRLQIEQVLPPEMHTHGAPKDWKPYDKKRTKDVLTEIAKNHPEMYGEVANHFKDLGNDYSYEIGFSIGLKDFAPINTKLRDQLVRKAQATTKSIQATPMRASEREAKITASLQSLGEKLDVANAKTFNEKPTNISLMVDSGSRGERSQLKQIVSTPWLVKDAKDRIVPQVIPRSYAEGMDVSSYWTTMHGARKGTIQKAQGTAEPGYLSKLIVNSTMDQVVTEQDCGTHEGVTLSTTEPDVLDRYLAKSVKLHDKTIPAGTVVTPRLLADAKAANVKSLTVRSPLRCHADHGICQKCLGLMAEGHPPDIGTNIGVIAAQSFGEPSVQLSMKAFHGGGLASTGKESKSMSLFDQLQQTLALYKTVRDAATLATTSGTVDSIRKAPQGGHDLFIGGHRHYAQEKHPLLVKEHQEVKKGEALSAGIVDPRQLLALQGTRPVQDLLTDRLQGILHEVAPVRRRNIEVVVKTLTGLAKIEDPGGHPDWIVGDVRPHAKVRSWNAANQGKKPIQFTPQLTSLEQFPLEMQEDWIARLNSNNLHRTLIEASREGWTSNIHGFHPIAALAHASEFGKKDKATPAGEAWRGQY